MKAFVVFLALGLFVVAAIGCGKKDKDKDDDEKGAIDSTAEYFTGHTALKAKAKAQRTATKAAVQSAVSLFEFEKGRPPNSLNELVADGKLDKQYLTDEYGKPLQSMAKDGVFIVRSYLVDKETGRRSLNWEERF